MNAATDSLAISATSGRSLKCNARQVGPGPMPPARGEVGTLMIGAKLTMSEYSTAWLAVFIFTLATVLSSMGNVLLLYFNQQVW